MKIEVRTIDENLTLVGYFNRNYINYVEVSKHYDGRIFWRVDNGSGYTISSLNRTKTEAIKEARKYIRSKRAE